MQVGATGLDNMKQRGGQNLWGSKVYATWWQRCIFCS